MKKKEPPVVTGDDIERLARFIGRPIDPTLRAKIIADAEQVEREMKGKEPEDASTKTTPRRGRSRSDD